ncbi:helix-turn-helix domain-containing protein [Subtercola sp. PAMC28395]|uniref:helix-turn-helix transcriptional regulator n=1 Tax=Subtercola sp. PAMC28395 TaxID=2846775 RepID=UPI001C0B9B6A|nr:helix-turn-helix transcriptional regulator [Subtercola sp. PAMC28395]QWT24287.1 helix-turn-helix domain-containing protein [Subtercola sp. PAMC28395]
MLDSLTVGRRIRQLRSDKGMTLDALGSAVGRAASQVSVVENGKRELKLGDMQRFATALDVTVEQLLDSEPPSRRAALEIALERIQRGQLYSSLGLPAVPARKTLSDEAIETILGLHHEIKRMHGERIATPEEARRANTELRAHMRGRNNYFAELETTAQKLLEAVGHLGGPLSQRVASDLASHLGFTLHYVADLPGSTRSITDLANGRIYVPRAQSPDADPRTVLLQALASHVLGHEEPTGYGDFLRQRVETNYLAGALLIPEHTAVEFLQRAKAQRELSVEDLRDAFSVNYETAAHRFTNLATEHLGIPVHFLKVHETGSVVKAYENDDVVFPTDALGSVEGQIVCRYWSARQVFDAEDRFSPYHQYTDKPTGTYWCTSRIQTTSRGHFSISVGTPFADARWFRGRDTDTRFASTCPDPTCCRQPSTALSRKWQTKSWPSARLNSSLLAAMPTGSFPGVDSTEVFEFLDRHDPEHELTRASQS